MKERSDGSKLNKFPVKKINMTIRKKLVGLFLAVILAFVALTVRVTYINITAGESYTRIVLSNTQAQYQSRTMPFKRGDILDRSGNILATSERVYNLIIDCRVINTEVTDREGNVTMPYREPTLNALDEVLKIHISDVKKLLDAKETKDSPYCVFMRNVSMKQKEAWENYLSEKGLNEKEREERSYIAGVWFEESYNRVYPQDSLACDLIGFCHSLNEASWGLEGSYNDVLNGTDGRVFGYFNSESNVEQTTVQPVDGNTIVSTCDINIQQIVRTAIEDYMKQYANGPDGKEGAKNVAVLVMDPDNGEILAMDSSNWYDLNDPRDLTGFYDRQTLANMSEEEQLDALNGIWRNFCISDAYEPGSVAKPFTVAAALETDSVQEDEVFYCDGYQDVNGQLIRCVLFPDFHGELTPAGALTNSCNDVMMQIAAKEGKDTLLRYQNLFNFGSKTGIDLPGENAGILFDSDTMGPVELATSSFGQGYTCTMIQQAAAFASIINGGYYYKPHVVKAVTDSDGNIIENIDSVVERKTVSAEISEYIKAALGEVIESGTGMMTKINGYSMGGKTGTAQKVPREDEKYLVSFIGFAPLDHPEVLVYVVVDEPNAEKQDDSSFAQGIAKQIFTELLPYMKLFPDQPAMTPGQEE